MPKLNIKQKNWLLSGHVASGSLWFGVALAMVLMTIANLNTSNGDELYAVNAIVKLLDDFVIIPMAITSALTGTLLCWVTVWGFFKFYWVITKWITTTALIVFGTFWLGPWTNSMTALSESERVKALINPLFMFNTQGVIVGGAIQVICLLAIISISIVKPWGRRDLHKANRVNKTETASDS